MSAKNPKFSDTFRPLLHIIVPQTFSYFRWLLFHCIISLYTGTSYLSTAKPTQEIQTAEVRSICLLWGSNSTEPAVMFLNVFISWLSFFRWTVIVEALPWSVGLMLKGVYPRPAAAYSVWPHTNLSSWIMIPFNKNVIIINTSFVC